MARKYEHCYRQRKRRLNEFGFQYLGAMFTTNGDGASNIKQRLAMAVRALHNMQYLWKSASKALKLKVLRTCETWVLRKLDIKSINAFAMKISSQKHLYFSS